MTSTMCRRGNSIYLQHEPPDSRGLCHRCGQKIAPDIREMKAIRMAEIAKANTQI